MKVIRRIIMLILILLSLFCSSGIASVEGFPEKEITIIVPSSVGGSYDLQARAIASVGGQYFGVPVVVKNIPGGTYSIGIEELLRLEPDGYTLLSSSEAPWVFTPLSIDVSYNTLTDVQPICRTVRNPQAFSVYSELPFKTITDVFEYVQKNPLEIRFAMAGSATETLLKFLDKNGYKFTVVPYPGGAPATVAVAGGHADVTFASVDSALPLEKLGDLRIVLVAPDTTMGDRKFPTAGESPLPIVEEAFGLTVTYLGVYAREGIPKDRLLYLEKTLHSIVQDEGYINMMGKLGFDTEWTGMEEFTKILKETYIAVQDIGK